MRDTAKEDFCLNALLEFGEIAAIVFCATLSRESGVGEGIGLLLSLFRRFSDTVGKVFSVFEALRDAACAGIFLLGLWGLIALACASALRMKSEG